VKLLQKLNINIGGRFSDLSTLFSRLPVLQSPVFQGLHSGFPGSFIFNVDWARKRFEIGQSTLITSVTAPSSLSPFRGSGTGRRNRNLAPIWGLASGPVATKLALVSFTIDIAGLRRLGGLAGLIGSGSSGLGGADDEFC